MRLRIRGPDDVSEWGVLNYEVKLVMEAGVVDDGLKVRGPSLYCFAWPMVDRSPV